MTIEIIQGDCRLELRKLPSESVHCCVTSPPYWGLRDYKHNCQIGLEKTPDKYVTEMIAIFAEVRRILRDDGTLWLNLGDSYNAYKGGAGPSSSLSHGSQTTERPKLPTGYGLRVKNMATKNASNRASDFAAPHRSAVRGRKPKDLIGIPWLVAFNLQADGWYLRQDIIWHKPNPMPESVTDRCTKAHEYIFLLSKSERYYFNQAAILEPVAAASIERLSQSSLEQQAGSDRVPGKTNGRMKAVSRSGNTARKPASARGVPVDTEGQTNGAVAGSVPWEGLKRNKRSVWTVTTKPYNAAHFATFPTDLIQPCILAGCPEGGMVLDPFLGSGTTAVVAQKNGCNCIGIELNSDYVKLAKRRIAQGSLICPAQPPPARSAK